MEQKQCPFCEKVIEGYTEKQVSYMINQHILSKHSEKLNIEGIALKEKKK